MSRLPSTLLVLAITCASACVEPPEPPPFRDTPDIQEMPSADMRIADMQAPTDMSALPPDQDTPVVDMAPPEDIGREPGDLQDMLPALDMPSQPINTCTENNKNDEGEWFTIDMEDALIITFHDPSIMAGESYANVVFRISSSQLKETRVISDVEPLIDAESGTWTAAHKLSDSGEYDVSFVGSTDGNVYGACTFILP